VSIGSPGAKLTPISCASGVAVIFSRARVPDFGETEDAYDDRPGAEQDEDHAREIASVLEVPSDFSAPLFCVTPHRPGRSDARSASCAANVP
jgi:hypothetical protein